ncbi:MAG: hypothetical protein IT233_00005, partial [Bacteroidia bacterium]|nr:hypothetical protein [Bacteroidia bacterium]
MVVCSPLLLATHNRAGEITYTHISGYKYRIRVTTYTKLNVLTDKCELMVKFGDGDSASAPRVNGPSVDCNPASDGQPISSDMKLNIYEV